MENVGLIEVGGLATSIMIVVQIILSFIPLADKRLITLIVSVVLSVISFVSIETMGYIEIILAVLGQVFAYDFVLQPLRRSNKN